MGACPVLTSTYACTADLCSSKFKITSIVVTSCYDCFCRCKFKQTHSESFLFGQKLGLLVQLTIDKHDDDDDDDDN